MVRVLSCHHFKSQKVGRCDGGIGVALADQIVIVALEHLISIYCSDRISNIPAWFSKRRAKEHFARGAIGGHYHFDTVPSASSPAKDHSPGPNKKDVLQENLVHSHSFPPVDLIDSIAYNQRGHYLLCLERREGGDSFRVRIYFHWDRPLKGKPMKARIAGLVSPTGGEVDSESLVMIEIAPEPLFATIATASCQHSANIVTLSADSRVNIYCFRLKEGGGRGKLQYADFDLTVTLQLETIASHIAFSLNHIGTVSGEEALILKLKYLDAPLTSSDRKRDKTPQSGKPTQKSPDLSNQTVIYNPKKLDPSQQVILPTIQKENRKQRQPPGFIEEFNKEIRSGKSSLIIPLSQQMKSNRGNLLGIDDILRLKRDPKQSSSTVPLVHLSLHPQRIGNTVGGTLCLLATETEMLIYHLPEVDGGSLKRVTKCPFTGPLQQLRFDTAFIHALTESGIETYSKRGLSEALRDIEGFSSLNNDCPLQEESPCLLGIRPFPGVRFVEANEHCICLLSAPSSNQQSTNNELWTIYLLESPPADQFYEDATRGAEAHRESSPEVYLTLLSEIHLYLRDRINQTPQEESILRDKYRHTTRLLGLQFFRNSTLEPEIEQEELLNRGIAFLQMAQTDAKYFFRHDNQDIPKDPQLVTGIAKFLRLTLPLSGGEEFPPSLSKAIVDFLGVNSPSDLARVTIETPWLRDAQGQRILTALRGDTGSESGWRKDLALILVIVSVHGRDIEGIEEIMKLLKHADTLSLEKNIKLSWILETRKNKVRLSDLAISLAMTRTSIHTNVVAQNLEAGSGVCLDDMIVAFHQGVNLNADLSVKEALTKDLRIILEEFFRKRVESPIEKDDEIRALHLLISSYLPNILQQASKRTTLSPLPTAATTGSAQEPFGKVPSFVHALIDDEPSASAIAKEHFYALASLLLSTLGSTKGAKDLVLRAISNQTETTFGFPLALLTESRERVIDLLLARRPELLLLWAKETFASSVEGWKLVVMKLKEKIGTHPTNQDLITTVTESVYLHLANSLSPSALEEVLEKEEEKDHFLDASKRVDLANAFADKVVQMSFAFLSRP